MKLMAGYLIIFASYAAGEMLASLVQWPIPGAIYGLLILFLLLSYGQHFIPEQTHVAAQHLIRLLALMLLPATAGFFFLPADFYHQLPAIFAGIIGATVLSMLLTAYLMKWLLRHEKTPPMQKTQVK